METLADKMELKWLNPETSKYVECDYFDLKWGYMEDGHYYFSVNSTDVIGDGDDRTASFSFDLVCEDHSCPEKFYHSVSCLGPSPSGTLVVRSV